MEIRVLRYFLTVAREENITRAADILHVTQPTLSRQLSQLEEELEAQLFIRGKRKIKLTDAGMLLRRRAQEIIELVDKTEKEFSEQNNLISGEISIGSAESASANILPKLLREFSQTYPQVTYDLHTGNADQIKYRIDNGLTDIGILMEPVDIEKYDFIRLSQEERWGVLIPKNDILANKDYVTSKDLLDLPIINTKRTVVQNEIASWFGDDYEKLHIFATYNLINNASILVKNGLGYAITIEGAILSNQNDSLCFKPFYPELTTKSVLVWKKHQAFNPSATKFIEFIKIHLENDR